VPSGDAKRFIDALMEVVNDGLQVFFMNHLMAEVLKEGFGGRSVVGGYDERDNGIDSKEVS